MRSIRHTLVACTLLVSVPASAELYAVIVEGLGGNEEYSSQFADQVAMIESASTSMTGDDNVRVFRAQDASRDAVLAHLDTLARQADATDQFAIYLIGHGSYDDHEYKFNIAGPDLTDADLRDAMANLPGSNQLLVNTSSASGAIAEMLASDDRLLVLATRSGVERHATRFGNYFVAALHDASADLDKNEIVSVTEAFQFADRQVSDYFERNDRLATEHARMEGERGDRFGIARLSARRQVTNDSELQNMTDDRDALNGAIDELRLARDRMTPEEYQRQLLQKMVELATLEDRIEARERALGMGDANDER